MGYFFGSVAANPTKWNKWKIPPAIQQQLRNAATATTQRNPMNFLTFVLAHFLCCRRRRRCVYSFHIIRAKYFITPICWLLFFVFIIVDKSPPSLLLLRVFVAFTLLFQFLHGFVCNKQKRSRSNIASSSYVPYSNYFIPIALLLARASSSRSKFFSCRRVCCRACACAYEYNLCCWTNERKYCQKYSS